MKRIILLSIFFLLLGANPAFAQNSDLGEAGFLPGNIWFSKKKVAEGETTAIHTAVFNNTAGKLSGTVEFYDKDILLGKKDFTLDPDTLKVVSMDWKATSGDHSFSAKITNSQSILPGGEKEKIYLSSSSTGNLKNTISAKALDDLGLSSGAIGEQAGRVGDFIKKYTPAFITDFFKNTFSKIEGFREAMAKKYENQKILSSIFSSKPAFYGLSVLAILLILRFVWKRIL
jgi:hypothetical protein